MARHLSIEYRDQIVELKHLGSRQNAIARALQRSTSTSCRELKRNSSDGKYLAGQPQQRAERRRRERPLLPIRLAAWNSATTTSEKPPDLLPDHWLQSHPEPRRQTQQSGIQLTDRDIYDIPTVKTRPVEVSGQTPGLSLVAEG